jgi:DNA helicase IV
MQWRMLGRRGELASWTVVGDPAQSAWPGDPDEVTRARDAALRGRRRYRHTLTTNYRNSAEIFDVAAAVIRKAMPEAVLPTPVRVTGVAPRDLLVEAAALPATVRSAVTDLLGQVEGTVGVITPLSLREQAAAWVPDDDRVQVVDSLEAKGMEYDGVVLVEPGVVRDESGPRTLYVALSRATQRLVTVATAPWRE